MLRIPWIKKIKNVEVLERVQTNCQLMSTITKRQHSFYGHITLRKGLEHLVVTGKAEGRKDKERQRALYTKNIASYISITAVERIRLADQRTNYHHMT